MLRLLLLLTCSFFVNTHALSSIEDQIALFYQGTEKQGTEADFAGELRVFCLSLKKYDRLSPKKRIKKIFSATKSAYLKNYSLKARFEEIDETKTFNCVTGSALFALIFDELDIPYVVVEVPRHVYLVAYPNSYALGVESTSSKDGIYYWTEYNKRQIVSYLIAIEEVNENEVKYKGVDAIIEDYFYSNNELDFNALVGLYFFNCSLYALDEKDYNKALSNAQTSIKLYKNNRNNYMMRSVLAGLISETEFDDIAIVNYMTLFYDRSDKKAEKDRMIATFNYVFQEALFTRHDFKFADSSVQLIEQNLKKTGDRHLFLGQTALVQTRWHISRRAYNRALDAAKLGYQWNPENFQFQDLITSLLIEDALNREPNSTEFRDSLTSYSKQFPFIWESDNFQNFVILFYAYGISDAFLFNETKEGFTLLKELNKVLEKSDFSDDSETAEAVAESYSQVATYYYRKKEYKKALEWIEKAEKLDGNSELIQSRGTQIRLKISGL